MQFHEGEKLDSGGFGEVFTGWLSTDSGELIRDNVVIKRLKAECGPDTRERFVLEMRLLRALDHPNVIEIIGSNASADPPFFVMPRAEGSLRDRLLDGLNVEDAMGLFHDVCAGVAHAHASQVIHRDLKPENVLLLDGIVKVSDFGLGKNLAPDATVFPTAHGARTDEYAAPEQLTDPESIGPWTDVFALGKMLWEICVGQIPMPGCLTPAALERVHVEELKTVIDRCCAEETAERYRDAGQLLAAIRGTTVVISPTLPVEQQLDQLIEKWYAAPERGMAAVVRQVHNLLKDNRDDEAFYYKGVPALPELLMQLYAQHIPGGFQATVERYGEHIGKNLPFTYCEVAAGCYIRVFRVGGEDGVRVRALQRALAIGATHNRYPVADQIRDLLWSIDDSTSAKLAAEAIRNEATSPWYDHPQLYTRELHPEIRAAMQVRVAT